MGGQSHARFPRDDFYYKALERFCKQQSIDYKGVAKLDLDPDFLESYLEDNEDKLDLDFDAIANLGLDVDFLQTFLRKFGGLGEFEIELFEQLTQEERNDKDTQQFIIHQGLLDYIRYKEESEASRTVNYDGHAEIPGSLDSSEVSGSDEYANEDVVPMGDEYDENNAVNRGNVFFIPMLTNDITNAFVSRGSGLTVISFGIKDHDCTMYLLLPTVLANGYESRLKEDEPGSTCTYYSRFASPGCEDTTFDLNIEGLKKWAPPGTRFMKRRVNMNYGLPELWYTFRQTVSATLDGTHVTWPLVDFHKGQPGTCARNRIGDYLGQYTVWWNASRDAYIADQAKPRYKPPKDEGVYVTTHVPGGVFLSDGRFVADNAWGYNPYKASCSVM